MVGTQIFFIRQQDSGFMLRPIASKSVFNVFYTKITDFPRSTEAANTAFTYRRCIGLSGQNRGTMADIAAIMTDAYRM